MGRKFVKFEAGYKDNLSFMDGSASMFWLHIQTDGLFNLQENLRISYGSKMGDGGGEDLGTGSSVLVKYSVDGLYYRARIQDVVFKEEITLESMYRVIYVDYGNSGVVFGKELVAWDSHLDVLQEQAVSCRLEEGRRRHLDSRAAGGFPEDHAARRTQEGTESRDKDPWKARCEAVMWLAGERLLQILKRQTI